MSKAVTTTEETMVITKEEWKHAERLLKATLIERDRAHDKIEELENKLATATNRLKEAEGAVDSEYTKRTQISSLLRKSQQSGQQLKDALHTAEQDKIGLQLKLKCVEGERDEYKYQLNKLEKEAKEKIQQANTVNAAVCAQRDKSERELAVSEKRVEHLTMLLEEAERGFSSDE